MGTPVKPYNSERTKKEEVAQMFDNIAPKYDFLNHFLSLGIDKGWRRKAIRLLRPYQPQTVLDVATGTGDLAIAALKLGPQVKVTGIDLSAGMLEKGREKMKKRGLSDRIEMIQSDSEALPFADNTFDAVTVAFGVRNFEHLSAGLSEMLRVIKPGAPAVILEFSKPSRFPMKQLFGFYSRRIVPSVGKKVSKDPQAYAYLPESVAAFPEGKQFEAIMQQCGYQNVQSKRLTGGIATLYWGIK